MAQARATAALFQEAELPAFARAGFARARKTLLGRLLRSRRRGGRLSSGSWRLAGGGRGRAVRSGFNGIGLIVEANNFLGDINLAGTVDHGRALRGGIQHEGIAVFTGVAVENIEHFSADGVDNIALSGVHLLVEVILLALKLAGQHLALTLQPAG